MTSKRSGELRIGLLLSDFMPDEYRPVVGTYEAMFARMLSSHDVSLVPYEAYQGGLPRHPIECDGYVISGSRSSVYEDKQWIRDLEGFIRHTFDASVPVFGICFGLQVMASAFGGTVEKASGGWGGGVHTMTVGETRPWMMDQSEAVSLIMSHEDQVIDLPAGAALLGSSDHCKNFLVEFTPLHVGIQGHPEFQPPFAELIYHNRRELYGEFVDAALESLDRPRDTDAVALWMYEVLGRRI
jgi:GMP synthase-like glutamine amidotransferase